jgi:hypothetical protein
MDISFLEEIISTKGFTMTVMVGTQIAYAWNIWA